MLPVFNEHLRGSVRENLSMEATLFSLLCGNIFPYSSLHRLLPFLLVQMQNCTVLLRFNGLYDDNKRTSMSVEGDSAAETRTFKLPAQSFDLFVPTIHKAL
jgi:hypothetical protein